jgi:branched-chain amino acid transport system permease protein
VSATDAIERTDKPGPDKPGTGLLQRFLNGDELGLAPPAYRRHQWAFLGAVIVVGWLVPFVFGGGPYHDGLLDNVLISSILALGFYWCFSLAGQFSFAVFAMYAAGAYVSVWGANRFGGFWTGLVLAMLVTGALGGLIRLFFTRLSPLYFAIATFGVGGLMLVLFREWTSFTGGYNGLSTIAIPSFAGISLDTPHKRYYLMLGVLAVLLAATVALIRSPAMRELTFSRDNGPVAATAGLKPRHLTLVAFIVGSAMQGAAGSLYAHNSTFVSLESFSVDISLSVLLMVLLGGMDSMYGPVIGAAIVVYLPEALRSAQKYSDIFYAGLVLLIVIAFPGGVAGIRDLVESWARRARSR